MPLTLYAITVLGIALDAKKQNKLFYTYVSSTNAFFVCSCEANSGDLTFPRQTLFKTRTRCQNQNKPCSAPGNLHFVDYVTLFGAPRATSSTPKLKHTPGIYISNATSWIHFFGRRFSKLYDPESRRAKYKA